MTQAKTLKPGWRTVKFGDVVREVRKATKDPVADGIERVVGLDHLDRESLPLRRWDDLAELHDGTSFTRTFKAGQVMFGKRRAYQRKVAVPDFDGICSGDILVFEPSTSDLLLEFLPYVVQSDGFFEHALGTSAGSLSPRTKWQELAKYEFVLPPLDEQQRIVEVIVVAQRSGDALRDVAASFEQLLDAVGGSVGGLPTGPLGDLLVESPRNGLTIDVSSTPTDVRALTLASVGRTGFDPSGYKWARNVDLGAFEARDGDLFITRSNTYDRVGLPFVFPGAEGKVVYSDLMMRLSLRPGTIAPRILETYIRSPRARAFICSIAAGTSASMKKINATNLKRLPVPLIGEADQMSMLRQLDAVCAMAVSLEENVNAHSALRSSLMNQMLGSSQP